MSLTNIDNLLTQVEAEPIVVNPEPIEKPESKPESIIETPTLEPEIIEEKKESSDVDDYGQPVEAKKERVYTESEVQDMIRRRVKEKYEQPITQPQQSQQHEAQQQESNDNWQHELESFVEQTLTKREQKLKQQEWEMQAQQEQAQFEIKFNQGAAKYSDFEQVVVGKPLTPQMVIATKGMSDPAAFIYAAAKTQSGELERISKISDPFVQAVELGKLDERMKRSRPTVSNAPKPIANMKGDASYKDTKPKNIDDILRQEDAQRLKNNRR